MFSKVVMLAGSQYCEPANLQVGYILTGENEPTNTVDPNAIKLFYKDTHVGYIPNVKNLCPSCLKSKDIYCKNCGVHTTTLCVLLKDITYDCFVSSIHNNKIFITIIWEQ